MLNRHTDQLKVFEMTGVRYQEQEIRPGRFWIEEIELGLGLWESSYHDNHRLWLRWYDKQGNWIPTPQEKVEKLANKLRELGVDPERI